MFTRASATRIKTRVSGLPMVTPRKNVCACASTKNGGKFKSHFRKQKHGFKKIKVSKKTKGKFGGRLGQTIIFRPLMLKMNKEAFTKPKTLYFSTHPSRTLY